MKQFTYQTLVMCLIFGMFLVPVDMMPSQTRNDVPIENLSDKNAVSINCTIILSIEPAMIDAPKKCRDGYAMDHRGMCRRQVG
ncbi:AGAP008923-PB-like protein [Anopheles sinensis]|uniref:AGAP008923-PB-like protein n=1 Tax=Anopheles sinensis TaxID=74873 RepID=A0A084W7G5_ANOSI|nr:AGAP008923-PB-like protein [Anopheles sinensis]